MTGALNASGSGPNAKQVWLLPYITIQQAADKRIKKALIDAAADADKAILRLAGKPGIGAATRKAQLTGNQGAITRIINVLYRNVESIIVAFQHDAADAAAKADLNWELPAILEAIEPNAKKRKVLERSLSGTVDRNIQSMITRVLHTSRTLSENVYSSRSITNGQIDRVINSALAKGDSAVDISKAVKKFILPNTPGGASYAAMRLGRTEINNAFHAQAIAQSENKPWVDEMHWTLSGTHKTHPGDLCERYARQGNFPKYNVPPKPHPQCMCYVYPVVKSLDDTIAAARSGEFDAWAASVRG